MTCKYLKQTQLMFDISFSITGSLLPFFFFLKVTDSPADVAEKADRIITMLPSSPNAIEVYTGANGILK